MRKTAVCADGLVSVTGLTELNGGFRLDVFSTRYTHADVKRIFAALNAAIEDAKVRFDEAKKPEATIFTLDPAE